LESSQTSGHICGWHVFIGIAVLMISGCAGATDRASVSGTVTLDGKPVPEGYLNFYPESGGPSAGGTILDGKYTIEEERGVVIGPNRIEVHGTYKTGKMVPGPFGEPVDEVAELIPAKYHRDSILKEDVSSGENTINLELASDDSGSR
jgi:hypothetical protein